ncbi:hypothetical protein [Paenibacillus sp. PCH8]|uniref:hypothetical protein n=1 Tax=Paenibacillus sp. PCH8 TaxID=2066524 RepID=UPI0011B07962|nr:hypothetical protein [Paenibacillus sp. PCH8]
MDDHSSNDSRYTRSGRVWGPDSKATSSENNSSPTTTVSEQTQTGSGSKETSGSKVYDNQTASGQSGVNEVIKQVVASC